MKSSHIAVALDEAVRTEIARLKTLGVDSLQALGHPLAKGGVSTLITIGSESFEITAWSENIGHDSNGLFVVLAGAWQKRTLWSTHHLHGFVVESDHTFSDMAPSDVWHYD